jgi:hypothetical protein
MAEKIGTDEGGELALRAFLYASDELAGEDRAAFERLLGEDQAARDALAHAVQMTLCLAAPAPRPAPAYRDCVRARLRPPWWRRPMALRAYRGHPLLWAGLGAAAAALLVLVLGRPAPPDPAPPGETVLVVPVPVPAAPAPPEVRAMADIWAELPNHDHLSRALAEEQRRKSRLEDRLTRAEERRQRKPGPPTEKQ